MRSVVICLAYIWRSGLGGGFSCFPQTLFSKPPIIYLEGTSPPCQGENIGDFPLAFSVYICTLTAVARDSRLFLSVQIDEKPQILPRIQRHSIRLYIVFVTLLSAGFFYLYAILAMPLLKADKQALAKTYLQEVQQAKNIVVLTQSGIPVNEGNALRIALEDAQGKLQVVKKRVFLQGVSSEMHGATLDELAGSIAVLYSYNEQDEHAPLKVVNAHKKKWKKEKRPFGMEYVGGWYATSRQKALYVTELADLPSKEELVGKFLFLLNHPVSGFARVLQAIADKQGGPVVVEAPVAETITETPPSATEAVSEEVTSAPETTPTDEVASETA